VKREVPPWAWWALGAAALVGGVAMLLGKKSAVPAATVNGPRVRHRERAAGVDRRLLAFLDWWDANGPFTIVIGPDGGVRTDAAKQADYFRRGTSKARTLQETPHGRAGALDLTPVDAKGNPVWEGPGVSEKFAEIGRLAKAHGFAWGGDWPSADMPHIEVKDWKGLAYPPRVA